jgi:hypothetical protein
MNEQVITQNACLFLDGLTAWLDSKWRYPYPYIFFFPKDETGKMGKLREESLFSMTSGMPIVLAKKSRNWSLIMHIEFNKSRRLFAPFLRL